MALTESLISDEQAREVKRYHNRTLECTWPHGIEQTIFKSSLAAQNDSAMMLNLKKAVWVILADMETGYNIGFRDCCLESHRS